jgi:cytoskeletal protein CcmA (bactofilin family)
MSERTAAKAQHQQAAMVGMAATHIVGKNIKFAGTIIHAGRVEVQGFVRGRIRALEISIKEGGRLEGQAEANKILNDGHLKGHVRAHTLFLSKRSETGGDIKVVDLGIQPGAELPDFTSIMTVQAQMMPEQTAEAISLEIATGARSQAQKAASAEPDGDQVEPDAPRQIPYLVSATNR